ncbi:hypothetical protein L6452_41641 [Arctium lappa]|uniref:Uncharacterized protein n=1 Tax=Arctium lappa TaxID=4217 RepID=A0ACB8XQ19_ARCLA|nr:hypothetical protein L6452_41641 [Arctium lappa]
MKTNKPAKQPALNICSQLMIETNIILTQISWHLLPQSIKQKPSTFIKLAVLKSQPSKTTPFKHSHTTISFSL